MFEFKDISIRRKLITIQVATAFIAVLICCAIFVFYNIRVYKQASIAAKNSIAEIVGINAAPTLEFMDRDAANEMLLKLRSNPTILNAIILDKDGKEFARFDKQGAPAYSYSPADVDAAANHGMWDRIFTVSYTISGRESQGTVILRGELTDFTQIMVGYILIALLILLSSLAVAFIISAILQRTITSRLMSLVDTTHEVAKTGDYSIRVAKDGSDEISVLSGSFNDMLGQIEKMKRSLDETNNELEERVRRRTTQLEAANTELESFSYSVSHDLRAPVRAMDGFAKILLEEFGDKLDPDARRLTENILRNAKKMGKLIDDLLAFSHLSRQDLMKRKISMHDLVVDICEELKNEQQLSTIVFNIDELPPIQGDISTIKQVWTNLISNAVKYSKLKERPVIDIGAEIRNNDIVYFVKDNGDGFDMKYANKLFGVFQRLHSDSKFEGTGVGLAIVHRIITKHGGKVWAEGKVGEGASFYFSLAKTEDVGAVAR